MVVNIRTFTDVELSKKEILELTRILQMEVNQIRKDRKIKSNNVNTRGIL